MKKDIDIIVLEFRCLNIVFSFFVIFLEYIIYCYINVCSIWFVLCVYYSVEMKINYGFCLVFLIWFLNIKEFYKRGINLLILLNLFVIYVNMI